MREEKGARRDERWWEKIAKKIKERGRRDKKEMKVGEEEGTGELRLGSRLSQRGTDYHNVVRWSGQQCIRSLLPCPELNRKVHPCRTTPRRYVVGVSSVRLADEWKCIRVLKVLPPRTFTRAHATQAGFPSSWARDEDSLNHAKLISNDTKLRWLQKQSHQRPRLPTGQTAAHTTKRCTAGCFFRSSSEVIH